MTSRVAPRAASDMARFAQDALGAVEVPAEHAELTARHLVWTDLRGTETHGLVRLPFYVERIRHGDLAVDVAPETVRDSGAVRVVDGHLGLGQVNADYAMRQALAAADAHGLGAVGVRRSGHLGAAGAFANIAAEAGAIGIATTNASPLMAPTGGVERRLGTNPIAIAIPHEPFPILLDIAMSATAAWSIRFAAQRGEPIPEHWGLDREGRPTTDGSEVLDGGGLLRPIGDHKGYGLALMVDILTGVLFDGGFSTHIRRLDEAGQVNASHFCMALPLASSGEPEGFAGRLAELAAIIHDTPVAADATEVLLPGEREARTAAARRLNGIPYPKDVFEDLERLADGLGISLPAPVQPDAPTVGA